MSRLFHFMKPADLVLMIMIAVYIALSWGLTLWTGQNEYFQPLMYLDTAIQMSTTLLLGYVLYRLLRAGFILIRDKPENPAKAIFEDLKKGPLRREVYTRALPVFIAFIFFFSTFTSMKTLIPHIKPFAWDMFFMQADKFLHFGTDPWRLLQPLLGYPLITQILAFNYILWLPVFFLVLYWQLFRFSDDPLRMRFLYSFVLTWAVNGTFLAIYFSSAGPCYYDEILSSDYFQPLMNYLGAANEDYKIYAVITQEKLWNSYITNTEMPGAGISAFPSVHVATAFLFVLLGHRINRYWFWGFLFFFILILLGSVHLAWHYAVDGYFSIPVTWVLWWLSGKIINTVNKGHDSAKT